MKGNCKYLQVFAWTKSLDMVYMYLLNRDIYTAEPIKALQPTVALVVAISKGQWEVCQSTEHCVSEILLSVRKVKKLSQSFLSFQVSKLL